MSRNSCRPPPQKIALVLVVDDEQTLRHLTAELLTRHGYEVLEACQGKEAMEQLCAHSPDLVVLDLNMPVMDGWEFLSAQQQLADTHLTAIPVLVVTGEDDSDNQFASLHAAGLVKKPFRAAQLLTAVESALHH